MMLSQQSIASNDTLHASATHKVRRIKLRAACTQCNAAKVKCTGERSGCERCRNLDTQCIYVESRVGKVPGLRARKQGVHKDLPAQREESRGLHILQEPTPVTTSATVETASTPSLPSLPEDRNDVVMRWRTASDSTGSEMDSLDAAFNDQSAHQTYETMDDPVAVMPSFPASSVGIPPSLNFDFDDLLRYPLTTTTSHFNQAPVEPPVESEKQKSEMDSQCVLLCCQIAIDLESYMAADIKSLRIVLSITRRAVEKLNEILALQKSFRAPRCMAMFAVIMYEVVELLEGGCACFLDVDNSGSRKNNLSTQIQNILPDFSLGGLGMDSEEQMYYRSHMVQKAIQQTQELLLRVRRLPGMGGGGSAHETAQPPDEQKCFADLEQRLKSLSDRVSMRK